MTAGSAAGEAIVAVPPTEHQHPHYFGRRQHHLAPAAVTINGDLDGERFVGRDARRGAPPHGTQDVAGAHPGPSSWCATLAPLRANG